jgi:hypothetical protein
MGDPLELALNRPRLLAHPMSLPSLMLCVCHRAEIRHPNRGLPI